MEQRAQLVQLLLEVGYAATESTASFSSLLNQSQLPPPQESTVAQVLISCLSTLSGLAARLDSPAKTWNPSVLAQVFSENVCPHAHSQNKRLVPAQVIKLLDHPSFFIREGQGLNFVITFLKTLCKVFY